MKSFLKSLLFTIMIVGSAAAYSQEIQISKLHEEVKQEVSKGHWLQGAPLHLFIETYSDDIEALCDGYISTHTNFGTWGQYVQGYVTARCQILIFNPHKPRDIEFEHGVQTWLYDEKLNAQFISTDCIIIDDDQIMLMRYVRMRCQ